MTYEQRAKATSAYGVCFTMFCSSVATTHTYECSVAKCTLYFCRTCTYRLAYNHHITGGDRGCVAKIKE